MYGINKYQHSLDKINPVNQLTHFFKSQLVKTIVDEWWWADFSYNLENKEKISNQLLESNVVWITQKWDVIIEISPSDDFPELKNEIYRLIEKSFELVWWNTWKWIKTDHYNDENFKQLVVVKNTASDHLLLSGYRYSLLSSSVDADGNLNTPMWNFFDFDKNSLSRLIDGNAIELWTAWVNKEIRKAYSIYGLHGIWDWLVYLYDKYQNKYFIWKMTIPSEDSQESYSVRSRDFAINYLDTYYSSWDFSKPVSVKSEFEYLPAKLELGNYGMSWNFSLDEKRIKEILISIDVKNINWLFPNMFPIYLHRINTLDYIWTVKNGNVCESGIIVDCDEIKEEEINWRRKNIEDWKSRFWNSPIKYWDYLAMSKSL